MARIFAAALRLLGALAAMALTALALGTVTMLFAALLTAPFASAFAANGLSPNLIILAAGAAGGLLGAAFGLAVLFAANAFAAKP